MIRHASPDSRAGRCCATTVANGPSDIVTAIKHVTSPRGRGHPADELPVAAAVPATNETLMSFLETSSLEES